MLGVRPCLRLPPGTQVCALSRVRSVHKFASIQKVTALPPKKVQSLLYPFSVLEAYLDRYSDDMYSFIAWNVFCLVWFMCLSFPGLWIRLSSNSFTPVWRTWLKQKRSSPLHRLITLITTSLRSGWTTYLRWSSPRLAGTGAVISVCSGPLYL